MVRDLGLKSDPNMHRAHGGPFRVRIEARQEWWRQQISRKLVFERINAGVAPSSRDRQVRVMGREVYMAHETRKACGSKEVDLPLFRFPLRGQTGAGGFPPRRMHAARQQKALARSDAADSPHKRAAAPLWIPRSHSGPFRNRAARIVRRKELRMAATSALTFMTFS